MICLEEVHSGSEVSFDIRTRVCIHQSIHIKLYMRGHALVAAFLLPGLAAIPSLEPADLIHRIAFVEQAKDTPVLLLPIIRVQTRAEERAKHFACSKFGQQQ